MVVIVGVSVAKWSGFLVIQTDRLISLLPTKICNLFLSGGLVYFSHAFNLAGSYHVAPVDQLCKLCN